MNKLLAILTALLLALTALNAAPRLNILLFTADDMNYDSRGVYGGPIKDLTPHIEALAAQGLRFEHRTRDGAYIGNAWSDGQREYHAEGMSGLFSQGRFLRQDRSRAGETLVTQTHAA